MDEYEQDTKVKVVDEYNISRGRKGIHFIKIPDDYYYVGEFRTAVARATGIRKDDFDLYNSQGKLLNPNNDDIRCTTYKVRNGTTVKLERVNYEI